MTDSKILFWQGPNQFSLRHLVATVAAAAVLVFTPMKARAAPQGGVVADGTATISTGDRTTLVNQTTDRAVIDWQSFNLAADESVQFTVPTDQGATLNRITSGGVSTIRGSVSSNGAVYFSNPNGLVFDATSRVTANGFFAATQTIESSQFMSGAVTSQSLTNLGTKAINLDGAITAQTVTALGGMVGVSGTIESHGGSVLLSSTRLTTLGATAVITVDAEQNGNGGRVIVWSDNHTDFYGYISARGGTTSGDGGFVEVSGKATLNYQGTVTTVAPHGKTGTLLLDPTDITISTGTHSATVSSGTYSSTNATSVVNTTTLQNALASNNITIDANAGNGAGNGIITVDNDILAATSGTNSLTLTGAQISINANITMRTGGNLTLNSTRASVWQEESTVITANTISGVGVDGFTLNGQNKFINLGDITNRGSAGISVKNNQALAINANSLLDGGSGGVSILTPSYDLTLDGNLMVRGSYLRLDVGGSNKILGGQTITATGLDVYYTSAAAGNSVTLDLGSSNFIYVTDNRTTITPTVIDNSTALPSAFTPGSGLSITTTGSKTGRGVIYGGTVEIQGISTGAAKDLRYIEGTGVAVSAPSGLTAATGGSTFSGNLMLVGSGEGFEIGVGNVTAGIWITANINTTNLGDLNLHKTGFSFAFIVDRSTMTSGGEMTLNATGDISIENSALSASGAMTLTQSGQTGLNPIYVTGSTLSAGGDLSLVQSGIGGSWGWQGFHIASPNPGGLTRNVTLSAGGASTHWITLKTNSTNFNMSLDGIFRLNNGRVRIDLGSGIFQGGTGSLYAPGLDLYYTGGAISGSANNTIDLATGRFIQVFDQGSSNLTITGVTALPAVTVDSAKIQAARGIWSGIRTSGTVVINGVASGTNAGKLAYIEGANIQVIGVQSRFATPLLLNATAGGVLQNSGLTAPSLAVMATGIISLTGGFTADRAAISYLDIIGQDRVTISGGLTVGFMHLSNPLGSDLSLGGTIEAASATGLMISTYGHDLILSNDVDVNGITYGTGMVRLDLSNRDGTVLGNLTKNGLGTRTLRLHSLGLPGSPNTADLYYSGGALNSTTASVALGNGDFVLVQRVRGEVIRDNFAGYSYTVGGNGFTFSTNWAATSTAITAASKNLRGISTEGQLKVKGAVTQISEVYFEADGIDLQPTGNGTLSFNKGVVLISTGTALEKAATPSGTAIYGATPLQTFGIWAQSQFVQSPAGTSNGPMIMVQLGNVVGAESAYGICTLGTTNFNSQDNLLLLQMGDVISSSTVASDMAAGLHIDGLTEYMVGQKNVGLQSYGAVMSKTNAHLIMNTPQSTVSKTENLILIAAGAVYLDKNAIASAFGIGVLTSNNLTVEKNDLVINIASEFKKLGSNGGFAAFVHDLETPQGAGNFVGGVQSKSLLGSQTLSHGRSGNITIDTSGSTGDAGTGYQDILVRHGMMPAAPGSPNILYITAKTLTLNLGASGKIAAGSQLRGGDQYLQSDGTFSPLKSLDLSVNYSGALAAGLPNPLTASTARLYLGRGVFALTTAVDSPVTVSGSSITDGTGATITTKSGTQWDYGAFAEGSSNSTRAGLALITPGVITVNSVAATDGNGAANLAYLKGQGVVLNGTIVLNNGLSLDGRFGIQLNGSLTLPTDAVFDLDTGGNVDLTDNFTLSAGQINFSRGINFTAAAFKLTATAQNSTAHWNFSGTITGGAGGTAIALGKGKFLMMNYFTDDLVLNNTGSASRVHKSSDLGQELVLSSSLTPAILALVNTSGDKGYGLVTTGTVKIDGVQGTTAAARHAYIEGAGIGVTGSASTFAGSLTLVSTGATTPTDSGISVTTNLTVGDTVAHTGNLNLIQNGVVTTNGIFFIGSTVLVGGNLTVTMNGHANNQFGILFKNSTVTAGGSITTTENGYAMWSGTSITNSTLTSGGTMILQQSQTSTGGNDGFELNYSSFAAAGDLLIIQNGSVPVGFGRGIRFTALVGSGVGKHVSFSTGTNNTFMVKTNNLALDIHSADNFIINGGRVRIDLGTAVMSSTDSTGTVLSAGNGYTLNATGLDVYYTGAAAGNNAKIKAKSFTVVNTATGNQTLAAAAGSATLPTGLTVTDGAGAALTTIGRGYATTGVLTLDATTSAGYSYLEGATIAGTVAAGFGTKITALSGKEIYARTVAVVIPTPEPAVSLFGYYSGTAPTSGTDGVTNWQNISLFTNDATANYVFYGITEADSGTLLTLNTSGTVTFNGGSIFAKGLKLKSSGIVLKSNTTVLDGDLRFDLGSTGVFNGSSYTLTANGLKVFFTGATTGNSGTIAVGSGSFVNLTDRSATTTPVTLDNNTLATDAAKGWSVMNFTPNGTQTSYSAGGMTITTAGALALVGNGVKFGGTVDIQGISTGAVKNLSYIEGAGVSVSGAASSFADSLTLVGSGSGTDVGFNGERSGILITTQLTVAKNLTLIQSGTLIKQPGDHESISILISGATITTLAGNMTLIQTAEGKAESGFDLQNSSYIIHGGNFLAQQMGTLSPANGNPTVGVTLSAGSPNLFTVDAGRTITFKTNNYDLSQIGGNSRFTQGKLIFDLGSGKIVSKVYNGVNWSDAPVASPYSIIATGLDVYYNGSANGNNAKIIAGSFTVVTPAIGNQTLPAAAEGIPTVPSGLSLFNSAGAALTTIGRGYATTGVLTLDATTSAGYNYLEGEIIVGAAAPGLGAKFISQGGKEFGGKEVYAVTVVTVAPPPPDPTPDPTPTPPPTPQPEPVLPVAPLPLPIAAAVPTVVETYIESPEAPRISFISGFGGGGGGGGDNAPLFTVSDSPRAQPRAELINKNINDPKLKAVMNTLMVNGDSDPENEDSTDNYLVPLTGNVSNWGN